MSRAVPTCHRTIGAQATRTNSDGSYQNDSPRFMYCIGSRCSMWHRSGDKAPAANLGVCGEQKQAEPWADPAAKETP